ncbi:MAG TPA: AAA family ATPase [Solirubrobacteraceae bacterium]|nr:AAA family ATPase [Solirubrobacteraceae bacterium]
MRDTVTTARLSRVVRYRRCERAVLDRLLDDLRAGSSGVLVVRGESGIGKTALLEYAVERASGCRIARVTGAESEMEPAFAGLHRLCRPMLDRLDTLPAPQRDALSAAFGLGGGVAPDRFLVGLAALDLLSEVAVEQPVLCVIDDAQWLDAESAQALAFVADRVDGADSVALLFAVREPMDELTGLPELVVEGLCPGDARELLKSAIDGGLDDRVLDQVVAETHGNPLALLELPRDRSPAELAGGFRRPAVAPLSSQIEESFIRRLDMLPDETQRLMLVAAAEPLGEPRLLWRAAGLLGVHPGAAAGAQAAGLLEPGARVRFRHPLVRSAVYRAAPPAARRHAHQALADATDPKVDPDRRAWHRAAAAPDRDQDVADELERSAGRAQRRGGFAAAAALLERAATLTPHPVRRARRALAAAQAKYQAGAPDEAAKLLVTAEAESLGDRDRAQVDDLRARIAFSGRRGQDAPPLLLGAARRLERLDVRLARARYMEAIEAATYAGRFGKGRGMLEAAEAARAAPAPPEPVRAVDVMLDGYAALYTDGFAAAAPALERALGMLRQDPELRWLALGCRTAAELWDGETWLDLARQQIRLARCGGALAMLAPAVYWLATVEALYAGNFPVAGELIDEARSIARVTHFPGMTYAPLAIAAWRGDEAETAALTKDAVREAKERGEGRAITHAEYATAVLQNGLGNHDEALHPARRACESDEVVFAAQALPELVEAAVRNGELDVAGDAARRLSERATLSGTEWALGIDARSRALLAVGIAAEPLYRDAIDRLRRCDAVVHLARAHLVYGEWLRGQCRPLDAREQLRAAHELFAARGAAGFAGRAARELHALGAPAREPQAHGAPARMQAAKPRGRLTAREAQVARLAREGQSNVDIGAELILSTRTIEYHLDKVFTKLHIDSRQQIAHALQD